MKKGKYVLVTAARNEAAYIERTIQSILAQTVIPEKWVIVSDGSTDATDDIVEAYVKKNPSLECVRVNRDGRDRNFAAKVHAINRGYENVKGVDFDYIGILDADVTLPDDYYESIIGEFQKDNRLGVAGGLIYEPAGDQFRGRQFNSLTSVSGSIQFFRRECYDAIGGLVPAVHGGEDTIASITARMNGWKVVTYPHLIVHHHKPMSGVKMMARSYYRLGMMDYSMGFHPVAEVAKCVYRLAGESLLGTVIQLCGFFAACLSAEERPVSDEFVRYVRKEHAERVKSFLRLGSLRNRSN